MTTSPVVACTLTDEDLGTQAERWKRLDETAGIERTAVADGLRLRFHDEAQVEEELRRLVRVETECCAWATWDVARADGALVMDVRSTGEGVAALHGMFVDLI
jgi:hypothetical protein